MVTLRAGCFAAGFLVFFSFSAAAQLGAAPSQLSLPSVLDAYFAWRGGASFEHLQAIHEKGPRDGSGGITDEYWLDRAGRWREELDFGGVKKIRVATPDAAWTVNPSGQAEDDSAGSIRARRRALIEFGDALRGQGGAQVRLLGETRWSPPGGEELLWAVVGVTFGDEDVYDLLIDPATGRLGMFTLEESGQTFTYQYDDWRMVDGVRMPFHTVLRGDPDGRDSRASFLEVNRPVDPSLFSHPRPRGGIVYDGPEKSSGWMNFDLVAGQIHLPVTVNGHPTTAFLDSGAEVSIISPDFADSVGLAAQGNPLGVHGVGPTLENARWVSGATVAIGSLTIRSLTVAALDTSSLAKAAGAPIPLILGDDAFAELVVDLDLPRRRIRFLEPETFSPPPGAVEIPLRRSGGQRSVPVSVEGRAPLQAVFDLGDGDALDLFPDYARSEKLLEDRKASQSLFSGIGGIQTETDIVLRTVTFGAAGMADVPASVWPQRVRGTYSSRVQGVLGVRILGRYRLICDFPHDRLYAVPDPEAIARPFGKNRLGVSWLPDGDDILVMLVAPGSPAAEAGLKAGDKIALIDGRPAKEWQGAAARAALKEGPAGKKVIFTLESGEGRTVTLADYY